MTEKHEDNARWNHDVNDTIRKTQELVRQSKELARQTEQLLEKIRTGVEAGRWVIHSPSAGGNGSPSHER